MEVACRLPEVWHSAALDCGLGKPTWDEVSGVEHKAHTPAAFFGGNRKISELHHVSFEWFWDTLSGLKGNYNQQDVERVYICNFDNDLGVCAISATRLEGSGSYVSSEGWRDFTISSRLISSNHS